MRKYESFLHMLQRPPCQASVLGVCLRGVSQGCVSGVCLGGVSQGCVSGVQGCVSGLCLRGVTQGCVVLSWMCIEGRHHRRLAWRYSWQLTPVPRQVKVLTVAFAEFDRQPTKSLHSCALSGVCMLG